jgi:hypothetical protein
LKGFNNSSSFYIFVEEIEMPSSTFEIKNNIRLTIQGGVSHDLEDSNLLLLARIEGNDMKVRLGNLM